MSMASVLFLNRYRRTLFGTFSARMAQNSAKTTSSALCIRPILYTVMKWKSLRRRRTANNQRLYGFTTMACILERINGVRLLQTAFNRMQSHLPKLSGNQESMSSLRMASPYRIWLRGYHPAHRSPSIPPCCPSIRPQLCVRSLSVIAAIREHLQLPAAHGRRTDYQPTQAGLVLPATLAENLGTRNPL